MWINSYYCNNFSHYHNHYGIQDSEWKFRECLKFCINSVNEENKNKYKENDFKVNVSPDLKQSSIFLLVFIIYVKLLNSLRFGKDLLKLKPNVEPFGKWF